STMQTTETTAPVNTVPAVAFPQASPEVLAPALDGQDYLADVASETIALGDFIREFGQGLLNQVRMQHPPVYQPALDQQTTVWQTRQQALMSLRRKPFAEQAQAVQACVKLLVDNDEPAAVLNA